MKTKFMIAQLEPLRLQITNLQFWSSVSSGRDTSTKLTIASVFFWIIFGQQQRRHIVSWTYHIYKPVSDKPNQAPMGTVQEVAKALNAAFPLVWRRPWCSLRVEK